MQGGHAGVDAGGAQAKCCEADMESCPVEPPGPNMASSEIFSCCKVDIGSSVSFCTLLLFLSRATRLFSYGSIGVLLAIYIRTTGFTDRQLGALLTMTLLGDAGISLLITVYADRAGRKRMLLLGCLLKAIAGLVFALSTSASTLQFCVLALAATVGVISPTGNEVGPFGALEQSILAEHLSASARTSMFALYNLVGYISSGTGSAEAGSLVDLLQSKVETSINVLLWLAG